MGGCTFQNIVRRGKWPIGMEQVREGSTIVHRQVYGDCPSAKEAFDRLVDDSRYESGHSYSGEIGMKHDFVHIATVDTDEQAYDLADKLISEADPRIDDKHGPAGCITVRNGDIHYLFFGWASS